jgi:hypothetical protein
MSENASNYNLLSIDNTIFSPRDQPCQRGASTHFVVRDRLASSIKKLPPIPTNKDSTLIKLAHEFIYTSSGFYSAADPSFFVDDLVFRGPYFDPLSKKDYLTTNVRMALHET